MNRLSQFLRSLLLITALSFISLQAYSTNCGSISVSTSSGNNAGCAPFTINAFSYTPPAGETVKTYLWSFNDPSGSKSTLAVPAFVYNSRGTYTPTLTVTFTDGTQCTVSLATPITVYGKPRPVVNLPTNSIQCFKGNLFKFTQHSQPSLDQIPIASYLWTFGDGDTSTDSTPTPHSYAAPGVYTVSLTVTDKKGCYDIVQKKLSIRVLTDIKPTFTASGVNGCDSTVYTFINTTDSNGMWLRSWYWDFGNGVKDSVDWTNITQVYKKAGVSYYPKLVIKNALNCIGNYTSPDPITVSSINTHIWYKDTLCWSDAKSSGVGFEGLVVPNAYYWAFNFGDPASGTNNVVQYPTATLKPESEVRAVDTITIVDTGNTGSTISAYVGTTLLGTYKKTATDNSRAAIARGLAKAINANSSTDGGYTAVSSPLIKNKGSYVTVYAPVGMGAAGDTIVLTTKVTGGLKSTNLPFSGGITAGTQNVWTVNHIFKGGPQNYCVTLIAVLVCGAKPTTVTSTVVLHVKGPAASITFGSPPVENYYTPAIKRPLTVFYQRKANGQACLNTDTINYSYFVKTGKKDTIKIYQYCGDTASTFYQNDTACDRVNYHDLKSITRASDHVDSLFVIYDDSQEIGAIWYTGHDSVPPLQTINGKLVPVQPYYASSVVAPNFPHLYNPKVPPGVPITPTTNVPPAYVAPNGRVYQDQFPNYYDQAKYSTAAYNARFGTGVLGPHDSDISLCYGPNYVFFTNFSYKYRLYNAADDGGAPQLDPGLCKQDPNYPYASDSLTYWWTFNGPGDKNCTSTKKNPNMYCKYSTEVTPYHFYNTLQAGGGGCLSVMLSVHDTVMHCNDSTNFLLKIHTPDAWWDTTAYCKMTWEMQQILPAGQAGTPGKPLLGFKLDNQPLECAGAHYPFTIDFAQTLPSCGGDHFWVEFDSAADAKNKCQALFSYSDGHGGFLYKTKEIHTYAFISDTIIINILQYMWAYADTTNGCKTLGVIVQNGNCLDTAWYHNYICFNKLTADFKVIGPAGDIYSSADYGSHELCPTDSGLKPSHIRLAVNDTSMKFVTHFSYTVQRTEVPYNYTGYGGQDYYYTLPFWPDSLTTATTDFPTFNDSISSVYDTLFYPQDSLLYVLNGSTKVYVGYPSFYLLGNSYRQLYKFVSTFDSIPLDSFVVNKSGYNEISALNKNYQLKLNAKDPRARYVSVSCQGAPVVYLDTARIKSAVKTVLLKKTRTYVNPGDTACGDTATHVVNFTINILDVNDGRQDNHVFPKVSNAKAAKEKVAHDTVDFYLPYPGFYYITSYATNLTGCIKTGIFKYINGHYAQFWADDSVVCVGTPVHFHNKVRYWLTGTCPDPLVQDCLDEKDTMWNVANPKLYRKNVLLDPNWAQAKVEGTFWFFGDTTYSKKYPNGFQGNTGGATHTYWRPGVYDVTMVTVDSMGCNIATTRKGFIKVVQLKANFTIVPLADTLSLCTPKYITYKDQSTLQLTKYSHTVTTIDPLSHDTLIKKYASYLGQKLEIFHKTIQPCLNKPPVNVAYDSVVTDTVNVDSILAYTWNPGDGRPPITKTSSDRLVFEYLTPGQYDIDLKVKSTLCNSELDRIKYLHIIGPTPNFAPLDSVGCVPFTVPLQVNNKAGRNYIWEKGDGTIQSDSFSQVQNGLVTVTYNTPGTFYLYLDQTDTTWVSLLGRQITCTTWWPDSTNPSQPRYKIIVHPRGPVTIQGDTIVCPNTIVTFRDTARDTSYRKFIWNYGNGLTDTFLNSGGKGDSSGKKGITKYTKPGYYWIKLTAYNSYGCDSLDSFKVHVLPVKADFTVDSTFAEAGIFTFHNTSLNGVKWQWKYYNTPPYHNPPLPSDNMAASDAIPDSATAEKHDYSSSMPAVRNSPSPAQDNTLRAPDGSTAIYGDSFEVCLYTTNLAGCTADTCKFVNIKRIWEPYNVITPNGDGVNDTFKLRIVGATYYHLLIFNRWGEVMFESNDQNNAWTGKNKNDGSDCPAGTYFYIWKFQLLGLPQNQHTGTVTIVR